MSTPFPHSDHFDGKHFFTPGAPRMAGFRDVLKWWFRTPPAPASKAAWPKWIEIPPRALPPPLPLPSLPTPRLADAPREAAIVATWINHSTFLLQSAAANILFDPVFTRCCGPFGKIGAPRVHAPGLALDALPRIDIVCLSHDHYDHCDLQSLRKIVRRERGRDTRHPLIGVTPLGNGALLRRAGFARENIIELDWWETRELAGSSGRLSGMGDSPMSLESGTGDSPVGLEGGMGDSPMGLESGTGDSPVGLESGMGDSPMSLEGLEGLENLATLPRRHTGESPVPLNPLEPLRITLTPAQHWSNRLTGGRNRRLWGGFFITFPAGPTAPALATPAIPSASSDPSVSSVPSPRAVYFAGDTGYHETFFRDIAARLGAPDLAMLPIGAYEPRWFMRPQHCNPAEAVRIHLDLRARQSVAMHWGAFRLTDEPRDEPPRALAQALREANLPPEVFKVLEPGESLAIAD